MLKPKNSRGRAVESRENIIAEVALQKNILWSNEMLEKVEPPLARTTFTVWRDGEDAYAVLLRSSLREPLLVGETREHV